MSGMRPQNEDVRTYGVQRQGEADEPSTWDEIEGSVHEVKGKVKVTVAK
jgi:hypothetical protein